MTTTFRKAVSEPAPGGLREDPELLEAVLEAYRCQEMYDLLDVLMRRAVEWSGASTALAWGSSGEGCSFRRAAASFGRDDPRYESIQKVKPETLREWFGDRAAPVVGLGPLATIVPSGVGTGLQGRVIPVVNPAGQWGGLIWLGFDHEPQASTCARVDELFSHTCNAVGHAMQVVALRRLIIKDDTADCFNRRYFEEFLPEELSRAARFRSPVSLIFLDMDNLKEVNTLHGHSMGSQTLLEVSKRIRNRIRKFDKLFRFGGDEFCIVLPETEWHGAVEVAERVREAIVSSTFLQKDIGGGGIAMTASLGIAAFPLHARTQKALIAMADRAMQQVKKSTKNAVGIAENVGKTRMAERQDKEVRELRLEGAGLFLIVAVLGAGLVGSFFVGRWYERSSAPPVGLEQLASDPLENVVPPSEVEDVDASATSFDKIDGGTQAEPKRQATPPPARSVKTSTPPAETPKPAPVSQPAPTQPAAAKGGSFYVQIGAYRDRSSADKVVSELVAAGYPGKVFSEDGPSGQLYKVRVGGYAARGEADTIAGELKAKGHPQAYPTQVE